MKRPSVPASVLSRPAFQVPSAKLGWMTCGVHSLHVELGGRGQATPCSAAHSMQDASAAPLIVRARRQLTAGVPLHPAGSLVHCRHSMVIFNILNNQYLALEGHGGALHDDGADENPHAAAEEGPPGRRKEEDQVRNLAGTVNTRRSHVGGRSASWAVSQPGHAELPVLADCMPWRSACQQQMPLACAGLLCVVQKAQTSVSVITKQLRRLRGRVSEIDVHPTVVPAAAGWRCPAVSLCIEQAVVFTCCHTHTTHLGNAPKNSCPQPSSVSISEKAVRMRSEMCDEIAPIVNVTAREETPVDCGSMSAVGFSGTLLGTQQLVMKGAWRVTDRRMEHDCPLAARYQSPDLEALPGTGSPRTARWCRPTSRRQWSARETTCQTKITP